MIKGRKLILLLVAAMIAGSLLTMVVAQTGWLQPLEETPYIGNSEQAIPKDMDKLVDVYHKIQDAYIEDKTNDELIDGAIRGMMESLGDPHSNYMNAQETKDFYSSLDDSFEGIGAEVTMESGKVTIIAAIKGSPSEKAGIRPQDQIIRVNGESLEGLNLIEAVNKIRGPKGTKAKLEILRPGLNAPITITVVRDKIPVETIHADTISSAKGLIGKIEITNFGEKTASDFEKELKNLENEGIKGLIIDVRGNPGGYLKSVLDIGNLVIPNKGIIVQIEDKTKEKEAYASEMEKAKYPIVGLINGGSASASEILAATLKESGHYPLVGETSFGKGTVQNPFELADGSSMKLTIAKWLTPDGNWIHHKGVKPDVEIKQPEYFYVAPFSENVELKRDMNNHDVRNLQLILTGMGYKTGREDGYFDKHTEVALQAFQKANGLEATGIVDTKTSTLLQDEILKRIRDPKNDLQLQAGLETLLKLIK